MKRWLKTLLGWLGYRVEGTRYVPRQLRDPDALLTPTLHDALCRRMVERGPALTFLQIGAFDGVMSDPLRDYILRHGWRGVMVEPQPGPYAKLRTLYADNPGIVVVQAAIDAAAGQRPLYVVEAPPGAVPAWAGGLASFDRGSIEKVAAQIPGIDRMIASVPVKCRTFDSVLALLPDASLDVLQIDVEGADGYLLSLFPFERLRPAIVHFEIKHLTMAERETCLDRLIAHGYRIAPPDGENMLAVLSGSARR